MSLLDPPCSQVAPPEALKSAPRQPKITQDRLQTAPRPPKAALDRPRCAPRPPPDCPTVPPDRDRPPKMPTRPSKRRLKLALAVSSDWK